MWKKRNEHLGCTEEESSIPPIINSHKKKKKKKKKERRLACLRGEGHLGSIQERETWVRSEANKFREKGGGNPNFPSSIEDTKKMRPERGMKSEFGLDGRMASQGAKEEKVIWYAEKGGGRRNSEGKLIIILLEKKRPSSEMYLSRDEKGGKKGKE